MQRLIHLSVDHIATDELGSLVREIWIGDKYHAKVAFETYAEQFPTMMVAMEHAARLPWGGSFDKDTLDIVVQELILQLNAGEIAGIITTPDMLEAFCEFLYDFCILSDADKILEQYIIAEAVAKRLT